MVRIVRSNHGIKQGSLNGTHFGGIKQYKFMSNSEGCPLYQCIVWVGNIMTPVKTMCSPAGQRELATTLTGDEDQAPPICNAPWPFLVCNIFVFFKGMMQHQYQKYSQNSPKQLYTNYYLLK